MVRADLFYWDCLFYLTSSLKNNIERISSGILPDNVITLIETLLVGNVTYFCYVIIIQFFQKRDLAQESRPKI